MWLSAAVNRPGNVIVRHIQRGYPLKEIDKKMKNSLGVILDDILAGLFSIISLFLIIWLLGAFI